jgi:transcriptional regulator with XRE-family HTH domain
MGEKARPKPARLAEKLLEIRVRLGLSQNELIRQLGLKLTQNRISDYELGKGEPPLPLILRYARLAGISTDMLIDDELDLPAKLPAKPKHHRH